MKKYISIFSIIIILILCITAISNKNSIDIEGTILLNMTNKEQPNKNGIVIYDCFEKKLDELYLDGSGAKFSNNNTIFLKQFDDIAEYNINTQKENIVYHDESFDFFDICNDKYLSLSKDNYIFLYNIGTKEKKVLVKDNGSKIHSWSKNGDVLYYSDVNKTIKSVNVLTNETNEICIGYDPVICVFKIAYRYEGSLMVKNLQTDKEYKYFGSADSYCFSPDGNELLIEDYMSIGTAIKNIFRNDIALGKRVVVWNYENNRTKTIIDACVETPNLICDWK